MKKLELTIPLPPTKNRYYGRGKGKRHKFLTRSARAFQHDCAVIAEQHGVVGYFGKSKIAVRFDVHLTHRGGDIQNRIDGLCDGLEHAKVFDNDKQIVDLRVVKCHPTADGFVNVTIWEK